MSPTSVRRLLPPAVFALLAPLAAQTGEAAERVSTPRGEIVKRTYRFEAADRDQEYALYVPKGYESKKPAPLVVLLHGLGSNPQQVMRYAGITKAAESRGCLVVAPYGYNSRGWYGARGPGKKGAFFGNRKDPDNLGELSEQDVLNVLEIVRGEFAIDSQRIYLMGHSMGGAGTVYLGSKYPALWAALAPLAPALDRDTSRLDSMKGLPVFVVTGDKDRLVRVEIVRRWIDAMKEREIEHEYREIEGGDHVRAIARNPEMIDDLFAFFAGKKREKPAPRVAELRAGGARDGGGKPPKKAGTGGQPVRR